MKISITNIKSTTLVIISLIMLVLSTKNICAQGYELPEDCTSMYRMYCGGGANQTFRCFSTIDPNGVYTDKSVEVEDEISVSAELDCTAGGITQAGFGRVISCAFDALSNESNSNYHFDPKYNISMSIADQDETKEGLGSAIFMRETSYVDNACAGNPNSCSAVILRWRYPTAMNCATEEVYIGGFRIVLREDPIVDSITNNPQWFVGNIHPADFIATYGRHYYNARDVVLHELGHAIATVHLPGEVETMKEGGRPTVSTYPALQGRGRLMTTPVYTNYIHENLGFGSPGNGDDLAINLGYVDEGVVRINAYTTTKLEACPGQDVEFPITVQNRGPTSVYYQSKIYVSPVPSISHQDAILQVVTTPKEIKEYSSESLVHKVAVPKKSTTGDELFILYEIESASNPFTDWFTENNQPTYISSQHTIKVVSCSP
ncbi:MAG: hypothetical protein AAFY41_01685 [Bacteroidota bacterium]